MSTYKVIQDIEAEDKLLGPLTLRQFIFAIVAVMFYYFCYLLISKHVAIFLILFLPPALFATFFAIPFGGDQPTEIWALAKIRFYFKPRRRIWDQSGAKELVTVNAPKKIEEVRTNGLTQTEVRSRLSALANTIDSRGWAVKNVNLNLSSTMPDVTVSGLGTDRLVSSDGLPQDVPTTDIRAADDILDEQNNPIAQQFEQMIAASTQAHRQQIMQMMAQAQTPQPAAAAAGSDYWFLNQPGAGGSGPASPAAAVGTPAAQPNDADLALSRHIRDEAGKSSLAMGRMKTIQPLSDDGAAGPASMPQPDPAAATKPQPAAAKQLPQPPAQPLTAGPKPAILELAKNNDLNVATIARQAQKTNTLKPAEDDGEVVIALR